MNTKRLFIIGLCLFFVLPLIACALPEAEEDPQQSSGILEAYYKNDGENGIPYEDYRHKMGTDFDFGGTVEATIPISEVMMEVYSVFNGDFQPLNISLIFEEGTLSADISGFNELVDFSLLKPGIHEFSLGVKKPGDTSVCDIASARFYVEGDEWENIEEAHFYDSYPETFSFFGGDTDAFLFPYQRVKGRYIMAHPDWEKKYITAVSGYPDGLLWSIHTAALQNFEKAISFLDNTYIRVQGRAFDSGVISLGSLVQSYNGCFVSRFTSSEKYVSHHSFGTAIDINSSMEANRNTVENQRLIRSEVGEYLAYNGILQQNEVYYYSFTYSGNYPERYADVPETVINYLLYELAFYRSGFSWAHYYAYTSDAMHFALTEYVTYDHDGEFGLRKVFDYISDEQ